MDLKKSYNEAHGYTYYITNRNSPLTFEELDFIKLNSGESCAVREKGKEFVLIVLYGTCAVSGNDFLFEKVGNRANVFEGAADALYIGKDTEFTVNATTDVRIAVCKAPAEVYYPPKYVSGGSLPIKTFGKGSYVRDVAINYTEKDEANMLYIGEFWVENGAWASYPPHKHDVDDMPKEGFLDEIYYFEFDKPQGFGFQAVYTKDGSINEVYKVENGDTVEVPRGYHPFTVAPGYKNYCLWIMAGKNRGLLSTQDEDHTWLNK